ncbi:AraC family transcriptional regulator [Litoreibacter meonggei]|uniref:AraC family transcriptional regulator n=1 Tax=Litoreibacter meonggei TaxID=1049199 RepID=A0A497VCS1_9RHOB|nr:AraC family transcriptional regulator [Litoreibacter meonggei]RLJ41411.1 AraC family transcriptional regulator [Litoreibacter meonggei]
MPVLPIPLFGSLLLGFLFLKLLVDGRGRSFIAALLLQSALQSLIISLGQHYGVAWALAIQPITAAAIPPLAWVAFETSAVRRFDLRRHLPHALVPIFIAFCVVYARTPLDFLIPAVFVGYGAAILVVSSRGSDALPITRLSAGHVPGLIWRIIGVSLIVSSFGDAAIVLAQIMGQSEWQPWIVTVSSTGMLLLLGALSLSSSLWRQETDDDDQTESKIQVDPVEDAKIMARLEALMMQQKLYLDPDLTLNQIARRLILPIKAVSGAINRSTGENVSRYINARRVEVACEALQNGESVTSAMLTAGFNTKSNFNREFLRIKQAAPSQWLKSRAKTG